MIRLLLLLILTSLLSNCGFHLRGSTPLPKELQTLYIQSNKPFGQFEQILRETLRTYKVKIVPDAKQAPLRLNILSTQLTQSAGAQSGDTLIRQYSLAYVVTYQVLSKTGHIIIPTQSVSSTTIITASMNAMMTSSNSTTDQYLPSLQREAVARMIYRLTSNNSHAALQQYFQKSMQTAHENKTRTA